MDAGRIGSFHARARANGGILDGPIESAGGLITNAGRIRSFLPPPERMTRSDVAYVIGCGLYPFWWLLGPTDAYDPWWLWALLGGFFAGTGLLAARNAIAFALTRFRLFGFALALHLHWLLALNPDEPFYLGAAAGAAFCSALVFNAWAPLVVYSLVVLAIATALASADSSIVYYPAAIASILGLANLRLAGFLTKQRRAALRESKLETRVALQATDLAESNEILEEEKTRRHRLQEELEVSQRMESVGRLAGGLAHDFSNELMTIRLYVDLLDGSIPETQETRDDLEAIRRATGQAASLTQKLLTIGHSGREEGSASVADAVSENIEVLKHLVGGHVQVLTSIGTRSTHVPVDGDRIERVLLNLVINARDAMPAGGVLKIEVDQLDLENADGMDLPSGAHEVVRLVVSDTGTGIDEDVRSRIFDPYFTTKENAERNGLGLSIVYSIVVDSGGSIRVFSEPGKGARFEILWPVASVASAVPPQADSSEPVRPSIKGLRVLLVEDEQDLRAGLARWLTEAGCHVIDAATAEEALALADDVDFDVLATDVVLPGASGTELVASIRAIRQQVHAVVFSGHTERRFGERAEPIPKDAIFLRKPFDANDLIDALYSQPSSWKRPDVRPHMK